MRILSRALPLLFVAALLLGGVTRSFCAGSGKCGAGTGAAQGGRRHWLMPAIISKPFCAPPARYPAGATAAQTCKADAEDPNITGDFDGVTGCAQCAPDNATCEVGAKAALGGRLHQRQQDGLPAIEQTS